MSHSQSSTSTRTLATTTVGVAVLTAILLVVQRRRHASRHTICGNPSTKGSEVVETYHDQIPNKDIVIVTGATSGLGRHAAILLARAGANVILAVRSVSKGENIKKEIVGESAFEANVQVWHLDLTSFQSVRQFANKFRETYPTPILAGLVNNAGVYGIKGQMVDGYQITWQTNAVAPALLTELLLPSMTKTARVINVSSEMEQIVWRVKEHCPPTSDGSSTWDYALSKACQVLHAHELTLRFQKEKSGQRRAMAVEPGLVKTNIARHAGPFARWFNYKVLGPFLMRTTDQGCATLLFCLFAPEKDLDEKHDKGDVPSYYYANCAPKRPTKCCSNLEEVQAQAELFTKLWG